jgi:hypothetical protein
MNIPGSSDTTSASTAAPPALWCAAETLVQTLYDLFDSPAEVAWSDTLTSKAYRLMQTWLRVAEALMRRLLLIEAAACAKTLDRRRPRRRLLETDGVPPAGTPAVQVVEFFPDKPQDWRVSFRCLVATRATNSSPARGGSGSRQSRETKGDGDDRAQFCTSLSDRFATTSPASGGGFRPTKRFRSAWPLALRFEALLRVYNDPLPYARRLAARLHARPERARDMLRAPPDAHHKIGDDDFAALTHAAESAAAAFNSS